MADQDTFGSLLAGLRKAPGVVPKLRILGSGARSLRRLSPRERGVLLKMAGLGGAEALVERLAGGDQETDRAFRSLLAKIEENPEEMGDSLRGLLDPSRRAESARALIHDLDEALGPESEPEEEPDEKPEEEAGDQAAEAEEIEPQESEVDAVEDTESTAETPPADAVATPGTEQTPPAEPPPEPPPAPPTTTPIATPAPTAVPTPAPPSEPPRKPSEPPPAEERPPAASEPASKSASASDAARPARATTPVEPEPEADPEPDPEPEPPSHERPDPWTALDPTGALSEPGSLTAAAGEAAALTGLAGVAGAKAAGGGPEVHDLLELRRDLAEGRKATLDEVERRLSSEAPTWTRRRTLQAWIDSAEPEDLASGLSRLLPLIAELPRPADRLWCLSALVRRHAWSDAEWQRIVALAESPALLRRLTGLRVSGD